MTIDEAINVIHKTIYQFFDRDDGDGEIMSDKDKLLLEVNKAICNNLRALEQEPSGDAISRQAVLESIFDDDTEYTGSEICSMVRNLPSVKLQYTDDEIQKIQDLEQAEIQKACELGKAETREFAEWVASEIFDENWEYNYGAFAEIACRKLEKMGIVKADGDKWYLWHLVESEEQT